MWPCVALQVGRVAAILRHALKAWAAMHMNPGLRRDLRLEPREELDRGVLEVTSYKYVLLFRQPVVRLHSSTPTYPTGVCWVEATQLGDIAISWYVLNLSVYITEQAPKPS